MAETIARTGQVGISTTGSGGTYNAIAGVTSTSLAVAHDEIDATDFDSAGYKAREYGESSYTVNVTANLDEADVAQAALLSAFYNKTKFHVRYRPNVGSGSLQYVFQAVITSFDVALDRNAMAVATMTLVSDGSITRSTQ